jgi:hypothetical protein
MFKNKLLFLLLFIVLILSACGAEVEEFRAGDIKDDFCGTHLNYQYCKCAFHGDFCEQIAMNKKEAKKFVNEEYDKWVEKEKQNFANQCIDDNGIYENDGCEYCDDDESALDGRCEKIKDDHSEELESEEVKDLSEDGTCKYDSDCNAICEGDIMWKMGCNPRENICVKTFDTDCSTNMETFGDLSFSMVCETGECSRNITKIKAKRHDLEIEKKKYSDELKEMNAYRDDLKNVMLDANKYCLNGIADMTNLVIVEFATRVASIMAGGIPDLASASVDYVNDALGKLSAYNNGIPEEGQRLKPHEYIKLNCDLYNYFKTELSGSDSEIDEILENAKRTDDLLNGLPVL